MKENINDNNPIKQKLVAEKATLLLHLLHTCHAFFWFIHMTQLSICEISVLVSLYVCNKRPAQLWAWCGRLISHDFRHLAVKMLCENRGKYECHTTELLDQNSTQLSSEWKLNLSIQRCLQMSL